MDAPLKSKRPLVTTALAPVLPQLFGSAFNIWYNFSVVIPLLATDALRQRFFATCIVYNAIAYPVITVAWLCAVWALAPVVRRLLAGGQVAPRDLLKARCRTINLPWWGAFVSGTGWLLCVPVFLISLAAVPGPLPTMLLWHLPISFLVSGFIAITHTFFVTELTTHRVLFPLLFSHERADQTPGAISLSLRGRGLLWAVSAGICPIGSLLLLSFAPPAPGTNPEWFAIFVGTVGIAFGLCTALMIARLVAEPIDQLRRAAQAVAHGNFDVEVPMHRADEFGLLAAEFNHMIGELRDKEQLRRTFGLHVGRRASEQILARDPGLSGVEQTITVMFVDIRSFTHRSEVCPPAEMVRLLNEFLKVMVEIVETQHGGMINKFLGDGFIALFGIGPDSVGPRDRRRARRRRDAARPRPPERAPRPDLRRAAGDRHRHPHRPGDRRQHRLPGPAGIHRDRQHREPRLAHRGADENRRHAAALHRRDQARRGGWNRAARLPAAERARSG